MKNKEQKIVRLLEEGFSYDTIKKMNDYHLNKIYKNLVSEAVVRVPADKFDSIKDDLDDTDTVEVTEDDVDNIHPFKGQQTQDPKQVGPSTNDGDDNYQDGMANEEFYGSIDEEAVIEELFGKPKMKTPITTLGMFEGELEEKSVSQQQQKIMGLALSVKRGDTPRSEVSKDVLDMVDGMTEEELEDFASTKHKGLPKKKKESKEEKIRQIEESIVSLIKKSQGKMITKGDLLSEEPSTAPTRVKPGTKERPSRTTPYRRPNPGPAPKPKASDTETAPTRVKPGTKERPSRTTPYRRPNPGPSPKPKAGDESGLPEFLKFSNLNIQFRDE